MMLMNVILGDDILKYAVASQAAFQAPYTILYSTLKA